MLWIVNRVRVCNLFVFILFFLVRWLGVFIKMVYSFMVGYKDLEFIEKGGYEFWIILYIFYYEVSSYLYKFI